MIKKPKFAAPAVLGVLISAALLPGAAQADTPQPGGDYCSLSVDGNDLGSQFQVVARVTCTANVYGIDINGTTQRGSTVLDQNFSKTCHATSAPGLTCTFSKSYPNPSGRQTWTVGTWWIVHNIPTDYAGTEKQRITTLYG